MSAGNNAIIARLGLETAAFKKGLKDSERHVAESMRQMRDIQYREQMAAQRAAEAAAAKSREAAANAAKPPPIEPFLEREKKVENQLVGLAGRLANVRDAGDAVTATFTALAESINFSLVGGVAAGAGIALGSALNNASRQSEELLQNLNALDDNGLTAATSDANAMEAAIKRINAELQKSAKFADPGSWSGIAQFFSEGLGDIGATDARKTGAGRREAAEDAAMMERIRLQQEIEKEEQNKIAAAERALDFDNSDARRRQLQEQIEQGNRIFLDDQAKKKSASDAAVAAEFEAAEAKRKALRDEIEAGNKLAMEEEERKRKAADAQRDLDEKLAEDKRKQLQQQIDQGNKLFLEKQKRAEESARERRSQAQLSLAELAREGRGGKMLDVKNEKGETIARGSAGKLARDAEKLEERARQRSLRGDLDGAMKLRDRADSIKRGIGVLRDSEKGPDFKADLDASQVAKDIAAIAAAFREP